MSDLSTTPVQTALAVVLTCVQCDRTYEPDIEDLTRGRLGCPDPDCGGWLFAAALSVPTTTTDGAP